VREQARDRGGRESKGDRIVMQKGGKPVKEVVDRGTPSLSLSIASSRVFESLDESRRISGQREKRGPKELENRRRAKERKGAAG